MQSSFCPVKDIFGQRRHTSTVTGAYVFVFQLFTSLQFIFSNQLRQRQLNKNWEFLFTLFRSYCATDFLPNENFEVALASHTACRTVRTSTSALLQILLSNFKLRIFEILGPRERCCPGTQEDKIVHMSSQIHEPFSNSSNSQLDIHLNAWLWSYAFVPERFPSKNKKLRAAYRLCT